MANNVDKKEPAEISKIDAPYFFTFIVSLPTILHCKTVVGQIHNNKKLAVNNTLTKTNLSINRRKSQATFIFKSEVLKSSNST